uniref:AB hydrolase-1 domain-containing protein n=1 Tax=Auxenochlorella protothecoides TaxID=3075 RepID=A0A1D1ZT58_AUXPR
MCSLPTGIVPCAPLPPRGVLLARPTQGLAGRVSPRRAIGRHRMPTPQAAAAAADGMAGFGAYQSGAYSQEGLDFQPRLSRTDVAASAGVVLGVCCSVYALAAPRVVSLWFGTCMAALAGTSLACTRALLLERQHKALQRSEEEWVRLLKAGTSLVPFRRSRLHVATFPPGTGSSTSDLRIHCLHGFGSALHSWLAVGPHIAAALGATITAHDMPGFGLSERPAQDEPYTLAYNGEAARFIMDEVAKSEAGATGGPCKRVLMGHSMGAVSVADEVIRDPQVHGGAWMRGITHAVFGMGRRAVQDSCFQPPTCSWVNGAHSRMRGRPAAHVFAFTHTHNLGRCVPRGTGASSSCPRPSLQPRCPASHLLGTTRHWTHGWRLSRGWWRRRTPHHRQIPSPGRSACAYALVRCSLPRRVLSCGSLAHSSSSHSAPGSGRKTSGAWD